MTTPLIGVSGNLNREEVLVSVHCDYLDPILAEGGVPLVLPVRMSGEQYRASLAHMDGLMLTGGNDLSPDAYGEAPVLALDEVSPLRDEQEFALLREAMRLGMPVLGICRGIQSINAALGGTLYQDLPSQLTPPVSGDLIQHFQKRLGRYACHTVAVTPGTPLYDIVGCGTLEVNSFHHQAVKAVAPSLTACALSRDGVVEAVCGTGDAFLLGVQWHPERMTKTQSHAGQVFKAFLDAARAYADKRVSGSNAVGHALVHGQELPVA